MTTVTQMSPQILPSRNLYSESTTSTNNDDTTTSNSSSSNSNSHSGSSTDLHQSIQNYSLLSRLHHLNAMPSMPLLEDSPQRQQQQLIGPLEELNNEKLVSNSAPTTPSEKSNSTNNTSYTLATSPSTSNFPKLYSSGLNSNSKSANFMHKHKRGFPVRSGDDLSNALMFGHHNKDEKDRDGSTSSESSNESVLSPSDNTSAGGIGYSSDEGINIVRKKSGEKVKSSLKLPHLLRAKSLPSTSTKMVHFDTDDRLVQVRRFSKSDEPTAVSAESSPVEERVLFHWGDYNGANDDDESDSSTSDDESDRKIGFYNYMNNMEWEISLPNFTKKNGDDECNDMVFLEHVFLSTDKSTLIGHVAVKNVCYQKSVVARYTVDYWKTATEVNANYNDDVRKKQKRKGYDRFTFTIALNDLPRRAFHTKSMFFCIRYSTDGSDYWDNNNSFNYQIDFNRVKKKMNINNSNNIVMNNSKGIPRRRRRSNSDEPFQSSLSSNHGRSKSDDLDQHFETSHDISSLNTGSFDKKSKSYQRKVKNSSSSPNKAASKLTARYSFGSSYGKKNHSTDGHNDGVFLFPSSRTNNTQHSTPNTTANNNTNEPSSSPTANNNKNSRPAWDSRSYQDLLNNYCFFNEKNSLTRSKSATAKNTTTASTSSASPTNTASNTNDSMIFNQPTTPTTTLASYFDD